ncbi:MAG: hypothetical protein F4X01_04265 [Nitrospira sp. SB0661_bin_20]|nr:hypothetical protein [Nitrospira sp. SB0661_bin_20]MYJ22391.1 hypothetical protein [Nitrospira sp. SB0673_bin_12]
MKVFVRFLVLVGVIGLLALVFVSLSLNALVKGGIETVGPRILGVPVTLEDVNVTLLSGTSMHAGLTGLTVNNPEGYETSSAVSLPEIQIKVDWNSLLTDTVIVEEVLIVKPAVTFEWSLRGSNLATIHENVKRNTWSGSDDDQEKDAEPEERQEFDKSVHVKKVTVKDAIINVSFVGGQSEVTQLPLPDLELRDIGNPSGGTTFSQASALIFEQIYDAIDKAVMKPGLLLPQGIKQLGKSIGRMGKELLQGLFGE